MSEASFFADIQHVDIVQHFISNSTDTFFFFPQNYFLGHITYRFSCCRIKTSPTFTVIFKKIPSSGETQALRHRVFIIGGKTISPDIT